MAAVSTSAPPTRSRLGSSPYGRILTRPGALAFTSAGVVARLPMSMVGLGIVVLVSTRTGSYATAGAVSAVYLAANAVGAVPLARLVDRRGQGLVLGTAVTIACAALVALVLTVEAGISAPWPYLLAGMAGVAIPNVGAAVRARWKHLLSGDGERPLLDTAFALEAVNDEVVFLLGPTLTTLLAAAVHPAAGLVTGIAAALVGTWALVLQRRTEPARQRLVEGTAAAPMPWLSLLPLVMAAVMLGLLFGACEVVTVAFADEAGDKALGGVVLGIWALGSLLSGLVVGGLRMRRDPATRHRWGLLLLTTLLLPLPALDSLVPLGAVMFLAGMAISPTLIAAATWVATLVPPSRLNEGMALYSTGLIAGVAPGAALAGVAVDTYGASSAYWVPVIAGGTGTLIAFLVRARRAAPEVVVT
jgi:MFS family permease